MRSDFDHLWDFQNPGQSEARFAAFLAEEAAGSDPGRRAELLTQLARARGLQRKFDQARTTLDEAEALIGPGMDRALIRLELERGRVLRSSGDPGAARPHFERAWSLAQGLDDWLAVDAVHMLAIVCSGDEAIALNERAMGLARSSADPDARGWAASLSNNLGWAYHELGRFDEALEMFRLALTEREAAASRPPILIARWAVARCLRSLGRAEEALAEQRALLDEHRTDGTPDGYVHEELGECLLALGRAAEARPHFAEAHRLLSKDAWLPSSEPERLTRLAELAR